MMNFSRDIHSLTDFKRNTTEFVQRLKQTKHPLVLTVNGKAELVVQDVESYQKRKDSGLKTCSSNACLARVLGQNKGFCLSWLIVNKQRKMTVFGGLLRIEIDLVSSSISKVFAQQGVQ